MNSNDEREDKFSELQYLRKLLQELEIKNSLLIENNCLLKFKIRTLEERLLVNQGQVPAGGAKSAKARKVGRHPNSHSNDGRENDIKSSSNLCTTEKEEGAGGESASACAMNGDDSKADNSAIDATAVSVNVRGDEDIRPTNSKSQIALAQNGGRVVNMQTKNKNMTDEGDFNLAHDTHNITNVDAEKWTTVRRKNHRRRDEPIIGDLQPEGLTLKSVPTKAYLHISKLDPNTTVAQLSEYLRPTCADVACEKLESRFPNIYSSFKVGVSKDNVDKLLSPSCWPKGTRVSRFFYRQRRNPQAT